MSTDRQDKSIAEQRAEIERYAAAKGYDLLDWYEDHGISGDKTELREAFKRMIGDANRGDYKAILVWDQDRFGRFDSMEAGHWIHPLRRAGVQLVSVTDGPVDWEDFGGRLIYQVKQEGKHQFLIDISRNTARGQIKMAERGGRNAQAPYGYDRMLVDEKGEHRLRIRAGERAAKPMGWNSILVPGDPRRVEAIRLIFTKYANETLSLRDLARILNAGGYSSATGKTWSSSMVRGLMRNPTYTGDSIWGRRSTGRYHQIVGGEIQRRKGQTTGKATTHAADKWITVENAHEALIDRETFHNVQAKLTANRALTGPRRGDVYLLTGLCACGHCGQAMHGWTKSEKKDRRGLKYKSYLCSGYIRGGRAAGCGHHSVLERDLVPVILTKLRDAIFAGGHKDALREQIMARLAGKQGSQSSRLADLKRQAADLDRQIDQGADRLLKAPDDLMDILAPKLSAMREERKRLAKELAASTKGDNAVDVEAMAEAAIDRLWTLSAEFEKANPAQLKELLRRIVSKVELFFDEHRTAQRTFYRCVRGIVQLQPAATYLGLAQHSNTS
jgi:DNA invertase Pin-like site-specific DNA recombinase